MTLDVGKGWRPDGPAQYRHDPTTGRRVGVLPATCKRGTHSLHEVGYRATERGDGVLVVSCAACSAIPDPDHSWYLTTTAPTPAAAELDDTAYADIEPRFVERRLTPTTRT